MLHMENVGGSMKSSEEVVFDSQYPDGLRVLVVDDDPLCLKILEKMLRTCLHEVITCSRPVVALTMLRRRKHMFDLVISDVHMPDMDGFKLLEHIGLEMDVLVIMMSADDKKEAIMKGVKHGACDYLVKPVRFEAIRTIWQHVVRRRRNALKELKHSGGVKDNDGNRKISRVVALAAPVNEGRQRSSKKKEGEDELDEKDDNSTRKKPRVVWSYELHQQFVTAVNRLGIDKAVPKKLLELMNVPGLTRVSIASYLQKYRMYHSRILQHENGLNIPANFGSMPTLDGLDPHTLAALGLLPPQEGLNHPSRLRSLPSPVMQMAPSRQHIMSNEMTSRILPGTGITIGSLDHGKGLATILDDQIQGWGSTFQGSHQGNIDFYPPGFQYFPGNQQLRSSKNMFQRGNTSSFPIDNMLASREYDQGHLMSAVLKQEHHGVGQVEKEHSYDEFSLDDFFVERVVMMMMIMIHSHMLVVGFGFKRLVCLSTRLV